eukprot:EST48267.1 Hypothetical protein SS50377_11608 [Spironucleus salmonicida]
MDVDDYVSPYKLDNEQNVPTQHRLFYHYQQGSFYCYGCNSAYETNEYFETVQKRQIIFPFHTQNTDWFFYQPVHLHGLVLGVINQSLYLINKLHIGKIADTPEHQGQPLFVYEDRLCFMSRQITFSFDFQTMCFRQMDFPKMNCSHVFGVNNSPAFYDSGRRVIQTMQFELPCQQLLFCSNNLALTVQKKDKRQIWTLLNLQQGIIHEIEDYEVLDINLSQFTVQGNKSGVRLEQASIFSGFDDQIWYDIELVTLVEGRIFNNNNLVDIWVDNIENIDKISDEINKQNLWMQRLYGLEKAQQCRQVSRKWIQEMKNEVYAVGKVIAQRIIYGND